jgi:hypothetical protein
VTRDELERKVDELRTSEDFVAALERLAAGLREDERELLRDVLLARGDYGYAFRERVDEPWWYRTVPLGDRHRRRSRNP